MLKFRVDRRASQNDQSEPAGHAVSQIQLEEFTGLNMYLQSCVSDMNGKVGGRPASTSADVNANSNKSNMVSDASPEVQEQPRNSRALRKAAMFGKRSNSMRRNPKAMVAKQGWLYKQASSGVKQWNKRWFVLTDRCLFYYKDDKEETVLGSLPLLSFQVEVVQPSDNVTRKFSFKVWHAMAEEEEEGKGMEGEFKVPLVFCVQVEHAGTRTYYFSAESHQEQEEWIQAMSDAAQVTIRPAQRMSSESGVPGSDANHSMVTKPLDSNTEPTSQMHSQAGSDPAPQHKVNGVVAIENSSSHTLPSDGEVGMSEKRREGEGDGDVGMEDDRGSNRSRGCPTSSPVSSRTQTYLTHHPNGLNVLPNGRALPAKGPLPLRAHLNDHPPRGGMLREARKGQQENVVLRKGFVPRTPPERLAQRKSSMTQLQQWVNQRRCTAKPGDLNSPTRYYTVNHGVSADCYSVYFGGPQYVEEYPLHPPGVRPDSICSVSAVSGYDHRWTVEEKRRSLRDGPALYGAPPMTKEPWGPQFYSGAPMDAVGASMRRLSIQPRSRSVPRSPSSASSRGPYSPGTHSFASPARSPSSCFDRIPGRMREDAIYADPSVYGLRRSLSSPKQYDYAGDRRSLSQGLYYYNYPQSPSIHGKMEDLLDLQLQRNLEYLDQQVPPFHDIYSRDLHPTLKLNEIETSKLLGRLCEQNRMLKDQEAVVHRLRIDKVSLEEALVATHQEMELYHKQPLTIDKLLYKKETLQNKLINIRGELSQASSNLTTLHMEFEALEDEANAIHGDLWEQLNAGGQSELVHRHIQKEFWRVQDVLEGLHKSNSSRGTDTAKHRVASGASGSFSTNSPASPLSSVSLTSPLSPFSPMLGSQVSPTKQLGLEEIGPPRPPLPKSYYPLESSPTFAPSVPPLSFDSTAWLRGFGFHSGYLDDEDAHNRKPKYAEWTGNTDLQDQDQERQSNMNKVGIVPPRTKSPMDDFESSHNGVHRRSSKTPNGMSRERPKSAVFPGEVRSKMSVEEQNERIRRNQSSSVRDRRRSLNLSAGQSTAGYRVVRRRRLTADEVDIKDLESAVRGAGLESPSEEIARLRRLQIEPDHYDLDISKELMAPDKVIIPERYLDLEDDTPLSPEEQKEKQKKVERIRLLIAKSNLQNVVPLLDGPIEGSSQAKSEQQLQEQEKRIEISCALAAEASRRSRLLSAQCAPSPPTSPTSLAPPPPSDDLPGSAHVVKV